jgi:hypothetical protein
VNVYCTVQCTCIRTNYLKKLKQKKGTFTLVPRSGYYIFHVFNLTNGDVQKTGSTRFSLLCSRPPDPLDKQWGFCELYSKIKPLGLYKGCNENAKFCKGSSNLEKKIYLNCVCAKVVSR